MSGIGRGRGWLNINKNANIKPGIIPEENKTSDVNATVISTTAPLKINPKYENVLSKFSMFGCNDDGILMNQKLKLIIEEYQKSCTTAKDVEDAFEAIYENCLVDEEFATKVIAVISVASFNKVVINGVKIRNLFIGRFQKDFDGREQLEKTDPRRFRITVKMLGDFFHKARLMNGLPLKFLSTPLLTYLEMLLKSGSEADLELFAIQLYKNGNNIHEELPSKYYKLFKKIRTTLAYNDKLSSTSKLWLLLILDTTSNRQIGLTKVMNKFYTKELGADALARVQQLNTELSIQTNFKNVKLENVKRDVVDVYSREWDYRFENYDCSCMPIAPRKPIDWWDSSSLPLVIPDRIRVSDAPKPVEAEPIAKESETGLPTDSGDKNSDQSKFPGQSHQRNVTDSETGLDNIGTWDQPKDKKSPKDEKSLKDKKSSKNEKAPRPILGVGSRLKHDSKPVDDEWKENSSGWGDNKKKNVGNWNNPPVKNVSKGWEHDDRFDNDYN